MIRCMRILIIGGGRFLGRAFAAEALAGGHHVTVFNRGISGVDLDGVHAIRGDRENVDDLTRLVSTAEFDHKGEPWDAVIDTCGFKPKIVGDSARALAARAGAYVFISSMNAYPSWPGEPVRDGSPKFDCGPDETEGEYGPLKAGCERAVREHFPGGTICLDAGLILGPHETSGRLTWWLSRIAKGGDVLAPGNPNRRIGPIDARDIARFGLRCIENESFGAFPVVGTRTESFADMLEACVRETGSNARLRWADDEFLLANDVPQWQGLPAWAAESGEAENVWNVFSERAEAAGLVCRPIAETVRDTWVWQRNESSLTDVEGRINGHGISPEFERRLLAELTAQGRR